MALGSTRLNTRYQSPGSILDDDDDLFGESPTFSPDSFDIAGIGDEDNEPDLSLTTPGRYDPSSTTGAAQRYQDVISRGPSVYDRKKPNAWRLLGAAALGGAAGWNNANPKARPINPSGAIEGILYPGQRRREQQYGIELNAAQRAAKLEQENQYNTARVGELTTRSEANRARTAAAQAQAGKPPAAVHKTYGDIEAELLEKIQDTEPDSPEEKRLLNRLQIVRSGKGTPTPPVPHKTLADIEAELMDEVRKASPGSPEREQALELLNIHRSGRERPAPAPKLHTVKGALVDDEGNVIYQGQGGGTPGPKPPTRDKFQNVERKKQENLAASQHMLQKDLRDPGVDADQAWDDHRQRAQQAQNAYEAEIEALTGETPGHFEYPPTEELKNQGHAPPPGTVAQPGQTPPAQGGGRGAAPAPPQQAAPPPRPPQIPKQAQAQYSPSKHAWRYSLDNGTTWQVLPAQ